MNTNWKEDPRLKNMDQAKLNWLTDFAKKVETSPKDQLISTLLSSNMEAAQKGIHLTDQETDLIVSILSSNMNPADRKKIDTLRMLSQKLARRK